MDIREVDVYGHTIAIHERAESRLLARGIVPDVRQAREEGMLYWPISDETGGRANDER